MGIDWFEIFAWVICLILSILIGCCILALIVEVIWAFQPLGEKYSVNATVKAQAHKSKHTNIGTGISSGGQVIVTTTTDPEEWDTTFLLENGELWSENDKKIFEAVSQGNKVRLVFRDKHLWGETRSEMITWENL